VRFVHRSIHKQSRNRSMVDSLVGQLAGPLEVSSVVSLGFSTGHWLVQGSDGLPPVLMSQAYGSAHL
jgi:hypothetical protein